MVRLQFSGLADNPGNLWWRLVLPWHIGSCSLTSVQQGLVKTGDRSVSHLTRSLFEAMLRRIWALPVPAA